MPRATQQAQTLEEAVVDANPQDTDNDPENSEVTRPSDLGFPKAQQQIEVERIEERPKPLVAASDGTIEIRMARTIEEFTYGNPHVFYKLEEGKRYRVPANIARYLDSLGAVYHTYG